MVEEQMDRTTYMQTIWFIRRYWDFQEEYEQILEESRTNTGIRGSGMSNPTAIKAERLANVKQEIDTIENSLKIVPPEYQKGVLLSIVAKRPYPSNAAVRTYKKWKRRFIYAVAVNKGWI